MATSAIIALIFAILGTAASVGTGIYANKQNREIADQNIQEARDTREDSQEFAREQQKTANQATYEMWRAMDNPQARVQQYKEAGLSVGLMYGNGGGSVGSHASATGTAPGATPGTNAPYLNPLLNLQQSPTQAIKELIEAEKAGKEGNKIEKEAKKLDYETEQVIANTKKIEEEAKTQIVTRNYQEVQTELAKLQLKFETASFDNKLEIIEKEKELVHNNILKTQREIHSLDISNNYAGKLYESTLDLNKELKNKYIAEQVYTAAQEELAEAQRALAYANETKAVKETEQIGLEIRKLTTIVEEYETNGYKATEANGFVDNAIGAIKSTHAKIEKSKKENEWQWEGDGFYNGKGEKLGRKVPGGGTTW